MFEVTVQDLRKSVPSLADETDQQLTQWVADSIAEIEVAFARRGRDFGREVAETPWLALVARRVVRDMVAAVHAMGDNAGVRSATSTTGPQSDSITYADVDSVSWGGVKLTPAQILDLGLGSVYPRGRFAPRLSWPELREVPGVSRRAR